jgi:hypothetical protein
MCIKNNLQKIVFISMFFGCAYGMEQPPINFSDRFQLVHDFIRQAWEQYQSKLAMHQLFPDHPKAVVHYLLTGNMIDAEIDSMISDEQFIIDYVQYEYALERHKELRNTFDIRLTLDPENTARAMLKHYHTSPKHLNILQAMRIYILSTYHIHVPILYNSKKHRKHKAGF